MTKLETIKERLNNLLEATKEHLPSRDNWDRGYESGYRAALEQIQSIIEEYK